MKYLGELAAAIFGKEGPSYAGVKGKYWKRWMDGLTPRRVVSIASVREAKQDETAESIEAHFREHCERTLKNIGPKLRGYAVILWDARGTPTTFFCASKESPIATGLMPLYVKDALDRHLAADMIQVPPSHGDGA